MGFFTYNRMEIFKFDHNKLRLFFLEQTSVINFCSGCVLTCTWINHTQLLSISAAELGSATIYVNVKLCCLNITLYGQ